MQYDSSNLTRRRFIHTSVAIGALSLMARGVFAEHLDATPAVEEGPFYPYHHLPLDKDNDLIVVGDSTTPAIGEISHVGGTILDSNGSPIQNAQVEIWQCDANGTYLESDDSKRDRNFQGYGQFLTGSDGKYRFRTIKPVPYSGRPAAHIHFKVNAGGQNLITTQLFIADFPGNLRDGVYRGIRDPIARELASAEFKKMPGSKIGEWAASFDVVVGRSAVDADHH